MSSFKNEAKTKDISDYIETNIHQININGNPLKKEERKEQDLSKTNTINEVNINNNSKTSQKSINKRKKKLLRKKRIFKIIKKRRHNSLSKDNNVKIIIKHFVNFSLNFINLAINEILRNNDINKKIDFKINYVIKSYISIDFIKSETVEDLLKFNLNENQNNHINNNNQINIHKKRHKKKFIIDIEKSIKKNEKQIRILKNIKIKKFDSQLDKLLRIQIIDIFKDLYVINKKQKIDLSLYEIDGIELDLNKFETFGMIRDKYKDKAKKLEIFDNIIKNNFIDEPKMFKIKKSK